MDASFVENYRFLARYNGWFNERLYDACELFSVNTVENPEIESQKT